MIRVVAAATLVTALAVATALHYRAKANATDLQLEYALRQITARDNAIRTYTERRAEQEAASQARQSNLEAEIARYEKALAAADRSCPLDDADLRWLLAH